MHPRVPARGSVVPNKEVDTTDVFAIDQIHLDFTPALYRPMRCMAIVSFATTVGLVTCGKVTETGLEL